MIHAGIKLPQIPRLDISTLSNKLILGSLHKKMLKFSKAAPKNAIAKKWIASQLGEDITEILDPKKDGVDDYIDDFMKSDSPQFKGKSKPNRSFKSL